MECNQAEELLALYLFGSLSSEEQSMMDAHLNTCRACSLQLQDNGEVVARLASTVPQLEVPQRVKYMLLARIEADTPSGIWRPNSVRVSSWILSALSRKFIPQASTIVASALVVAMVFSGVWFNNRLNDLESDNRALSMQIENAAERETSMMNMARDQRNFTYEALRMTATSGISVNLLRATGPSPTARGMMMFSRSEPYALLLVLNLPPLPEDKVYQVWLIRGNQRYGAGLFTVDSLGYGQAVVIPVIPFVEVDAIGITIEPEGGSFGPTGTNVLSGDL